MICILSVQDLLKQLGENWVLVVVFALISAFYIIGYLHERKVTRSMEELKAQIEKDKITALKFNT